MSVQAEVLPIRKPVAGSQPVVAEQGEAASA